MRNLFKKALAFCLVAALALTCFAGTFYAAEPYTATISVDSKTITLGTETVDVVLNISSPAAGINEALFKVSSDLGTVTAVDVAEDDIAIIDYATNDGETVSDYGSFYLSAKNTSDGENGTVLGSINAATITVTFAVAAGVGEYPINIETSGVKAASKDEDVITLSYQTANVIVEEEATEPECEHAWEVTAYTPATGSDNSDNIEFSKGSVSLACSKCDEEKNDLVVNYSYYSRTASISASVESEIQLKFAARYERDFDRIVSGADITEAYLVLDHKRGEELIATTSVDLFKAEDTMDGSYRAYSVAYGLQAYAYSDDVTGYVFAYDETTDAWYCGVKTSSSIKTLVGGLLAKSTDDKHKAVLVNLLNYGAAAQVGFGVNTDNLANADIDAYQQYATDADPYTARDLELVTENVGQYYFYNFSGNAESKVTLRPYIRLPKAYTDVASNEIFASETLKVVVTYTDFLGVAHNEEFVYGSDTLGGEGLIDEGRVGRYFFYLPISAADVRSEITMTIYRNDEIAGPVCNYTFSDFAATYAAGSSTANMKAVVAKMMAYGDAAYDYLTSK